MKHLIALLLLSTIGASAQLVTNANVDLVWSQAAEDALRIAYKIDENLRTNGIAPYLEATNSVSYKVFIGELIGNRIQADSDNLAAQNEARFLATFRTLQTTDAAAYNRIYRIAFNKGSQ